MTPADKIINEIKKIEKILDRNIIKILRPSLNGLKLLDFSKALVFMNKMANDGNFSQLIHNKYTENILNDINKKCSNIIETSLEMMPDADSLIIMKNSVEEFSNQAATIQLKGI